MLKPDEGWFDAYALLQGFRRKARSLGVEERVGEVVGLERDGDRLTGVRLADGSRDRRRLGGQRGRPARRVGGRHGRDRAAGTAAEAPRLPLRAPVSLGAAPLTIDPSRRVRAAGGRRLHRRLLAARRRAGSGHAGPGVGSGAVRNVRLAGAGAPRSRVRPAAAARHLGRPLRGQHARPQRDHRSASGHREPAVRERLLRSRAPAGTSRRARARRVDRGGRYETLDLRRSASNASLATSPSASSTSSEPSAHQEHPTSAG